MPDDGERTELVRGRVVREPQPSYEHGRLQARLSALLHDHIRETRLDLVCTGNLGVVTSEEQRTVRGPDLAVIRRSRAPSRPPGFLDGAPELVVEVVSTSNTAEGIQEKIAEYFAAGAMLVWIVYPQTRRIAVHSSLRDATFLYPGDELNGGDLLPQLRLQVADIFADD